MKSKIEEKEKEVIELLKEGKSKTEIGRALGFNPSTVGSYIHSRGLSKYRPAPIDWKLEKEKLHKLYVKDKLSISYIRKIYKVSYNTLKNVLKDFGYLNNTAIPIISKEDPKKHICPICGESFIPRLDNQIYCSTECAKQGQRRVPNKESLLKVLEDNNWNYTKTGKDFGVSDNAIKKWAVKCGIHKPKLRYWSDVVDRESAQKKIDELGIRTASELIDNYGGLSDKIGRLNLRSLLKFPGTEFDSSWEERMFNLIKDNVSFTSLEHNVILDPECRYKHPLVFDIVIEYQDFTKTVIEIQGPTHFKTLYDDEGSKYETVRKRDEIKYEYCMTHDIDLYYFTYEPKLLEDYGYPHYVYTDENLLLGKLQK